MFVLLSVFYVCKYLSIICILCLYYYLYFMFYYLYFMFVLLSVFYVCTIICILCLYVPFYYLYFMFVLTYFILIYTVMLRLANIGAGYFGLKSILAKIAFSFFLWTFNFFQLSQKHRFWLISLDLTEGFVSNFGHKSL